jgi:hypothetical protein
MEGSIFSWADEWDAKPRILHPSDDDVRNSTLFVCADTPASVECAILQYILGTLLMLIAMLYLNAAGSFRRGRGRSVQTTRRNAAQLTSLGGKAASARNLMNSLSKRKQSSSSVKPSPLPLPIESDTVQDFTNNPNKELADGVTAALEAQKLPIAQTDSKSKNETSNSKANPLDKRSSYSSRRASQRATVVVETSTDITGTIPKRLSSRNTIHHGPAVAVEKPPETVPKRLSSRNTIHHGPSSNNRRQSAMITGTGKRHPVKNGYSLRSLHMGRSSRVVNDWSSAARTAPGTSNQVMREKMTQKLMLAGGTWNDVLYCLLVGICCTLGFGVQYRSDNIRGILCNTFAALAQVNPALRMSTTLANATDLHKLFDEAYHSKWRVQFTSAATRWMAYVITPLFMTTIWVLSLMGNYTNEHFYASCEVVTGSWILVEAVIVFTERGSVLVQLAHVHRVADERNLGNKDAAKSRSSALTNHAKHLMQAVLERLLRSILCFSLVRSYTTESGEQVVNIRIVQMVVLLISTTHIYWTSRRKSGRRHRGNEAANQSSVANGASFVDVNDEAGKKQERLFSWEDGDDDLLASHQ